MGFITSGSSVTYQAYLTQEGRELLLKGDKSLMKIKYFSIGDSDANYLIEKPLGSGYVPDVNGDNLDCVKSIAVNIGIKKQINLK